MALIAEQSNEGPVAYLLAVPIEASEESLFVWQLAAIDYGQREEATLALLRVLKDLALERHIQTVAFSTRPHSATHRLISRYANQLVSRSPQLISVLPSGVAPDESEYRVNLG